MCESCGGHELRLTKATLIVEGMSCDHCRKAVEKSVRALPGMVAAEVDLTSRTLTVEYEAGKVGPGAIRLAVEEAGFTIGL